MISLDQAFFDYEPYPMGLLRPVLDPGTYSTLCATYPGKELFEFKPKLGNKYSLSEVNNAANYRQFIRGTPEWRRFYEYVKGATFVPSVLEMLARHNIDLGLRRYRVVSRRAVTRRASAVSRLLRVTEISARFEFSMMGADGGHILPHTDSPQKLITLVFSMMPEGEWNPAWGGGTDVVLPSDRTRVFNLMNRSVPFSEVDVIKTWDFTPNQCLLFIKTFNSWHSVSPMRGPPDAPLRKTLTVNIEAKL